MNADKEIMENLLNTVKGVCDLYMHGTIESSTQNVHAAFDDALEESLCMQNEIYNQMSQQGWYPMEQAPQQQIDGSPPASRCAGFPFARRSLSKGRLP